MRIDLIQHLRESCRSFNCAAILLRILILFGSRNILSY